MASVITYSAAAKLIRRSSLPLCLLLYGPEDYLKEELIRSAAEKHLAPDVRAMNLSAFDLEETSVEDVIAACEAFPFLGGCRMVVARNAQRLSRSKRMTERLFQALKTPPPTLLLFLVAGELETGSWLLKALPKSFKAVHLRAPREAELARWVGAKARSLGIELAPETARRLLDLAGGSLWSLRNELEKLALCTPKGQTLSAETADRLLSGSPDLSAFALADAVRRNDREGAAEAVVLLQERGEHPVKLTAIITSQVLRAWVAAEERSGSADAAGKFKKRALLLCETDAALKRSKLDPELATQLLADALTRTRA